MHLLGFSPLCCMQLSWMTSLGRRRQEAAGACCRPQSLPLCLFCPDILALGHHPFQTPMPHCLHISLLSIAVAAAAACILTSTQLCTPRETVSAAFQWRHSYYLCCSYIFPSLPLAGLLAAPVPPSSSHLPDVSFLIHQSSLPSPSLCGK